MILLYFLTALFIAWIWVDYYRLIDVFEKEKLVYLIITFLFGCASVFLVFGINNWFLNDFPFRLGAGWFYDLMYTTFKIGAVEEFAKLMAFLASFLLFRKQFNEPIDYLAYICTAALGFSAVENIMYFVQAGAHIISARAILSTVGHMFDTALIAYGYILYRYHPKSYSILIIPLFFLLASLAHGLYDFWIMYSGFQGFGTLLLIAYFMYTLSFFMVVLNNSINNSHLFTYKTIVDPKQVSSRLLTYYAIVFAVEFLIISFEHGISAGIMNINTSLFTAGFVVLVTSIRMSRFRLIKNHWYPLKLEMPFEIYGLPGIMRGGIRIKGESHNDASLSHHYQEQVILRPFSKRKSYLGRPVRAFIKDKIFMISHHPFFPLIMEDEDPLRAQHALIPKTYGKTEHKTYPIVALVKAIKPLQEENFAQDGSEFKFLEWVVVKPMPDEMHDQISNSR